FLSFASREKRAAAALLRAASAEDVKVQGVAVPENPLARLFCGFHDHVHSVGVCREKAEVDDHLTPHRLAFQPEKSPMAGCSVGLFADLAELFIQPRRELKRRVHVGKQKNRRYAVLIAIDARTGSAGSR